METTDIPIPGGRRPATKSIQSLNIHNPNVPTVQTIQSSTKRKPKKKIVRSTRRK